jgi:uncharacterized protein with PIN domain
MKFAADAMLGKLAKWLRILGYDTSYERDIDDESLALAAARQGRLLLTRDTRLIRKLRAGEYLFIRDNAPLDQLRQAFKELNLRADEGLIFSRCTLCNTSLVDMDRDAAQGLVPEYVFMKAEGFKRCPDCGRVYWPGTHIKRIKDRLALMIGGAEGR